MTKPKAEPGIRVDGGRRIDLAARRAKKAGEIAKPLRPAPTVEQVKSMARARAKAEADQAKRVARLRTMDGGKEGARITRVNVRISETRRDSYAMRCRPGTFEWTYGRNKQTALFHAGNHFARLWEQAGVTVASSADFLRGTGSGYKTGLPDGRVVALDKLKGTVERLGHSSFERLMHYCVEGFTARQIANMEGESDREIAIVLKHDLRDCALWFGFLTKRG